jgi:hypothetical protein
VTKRQKDDARRMKPSRFLRRGSSFALEL